ncbi:hypothetical protein FG386_002882 [Cryptosporidium ryanae]|uniref:uncharacterized protein n=1 Tax=Cryptosporidium ryanae TaxID=515981 RepID=UPI00351A6C72|nr:hypothetical protein FG386_002882 [Cryptosporidium ryanae]
MVQVSGIEMKDGSKNGSLYTDSDEKKRVGTSGIFLSEEGATEVCGEENDRKPTINARRGIASMIVNMAFGDEGASKQQYKKGSIGYMLSRIQKVMRMISLLFSVVIILFLITSRINRGRKGISNSYPIGSVGRSVKFDLMLEESMSTEKSTDGGTEASPEPVSNSEALDDPEYWADDDDKDLWDDDDEDYLEMDIVKSEEIDDEKGTASGKSDESKDKLPQKITGERNKGLRSKGIKVSLPSSLTLYGRVSDKDSYINGIYNIIMENDNAKDKRYPKLHHGRAVYMKKGTNNLSDLYIYFDGRHEFWILNKNLDSNPSNPLAFLPDHALIPIRHVGPYGAHSNTCWVFRHYENDKVSVIKDNTVRIVENSSINNPRIPVYITKSTHNWHIKHHKEKEPQINDKEGTKSYTDPYSVGY